MRFLGIDPSLRHTGLALTNGDSDGGEAQYHEIKTGGLDLVSSIEVLEPAFESWLEEMQVDTADTVFAVERMLSGADINGWLLMIVQTALWRGIHRRAVAQTGSSKGVRMVAPYPPQLREYIRKVHGVEGSGKMPVQVAHAKLVGLRKRVSSHKAEAWFLTRFAKAVLDGTWFYSQSTTAPVLAPWILIRDRKGEGRKRRRREQSST